MARVTASVDVLAFADEVLLSATAEITVDGVTAAISFATCDAAKVSFEKDEAGFLLTVFGVSVSLLNTRRLIKRLNIERRLAPQV